MSRECGVNPLHSLLFVFFEIIEWRCLAISKQELQINEEIRDREVLVIDADGEKKGVMSARDAQKLAYDQNLDLVKIAPQATPPVCRVMDYGKYCFEQQKREKEARKNQRTVEIKEIRMFSAIDTHDFETKVAQGKKFLQGGDKVKVSVRFRKRAIAHPHLGEELLERYRDEIGDVAVVDKPPKMEGRAIVMFMSPKQNKPEKGDKPQKKAKPQPKPQTESAAEAPAEQAAEEA